jgi:cbb3-type cytochrome oxidase maturation protein
MESLYLLVPLSIALVFGALWVFFKASDDGQFEDLEGPAHQILLDDDAAQSSARQVSPGGKR